MGVKSLRESRFGLFSSPYVAARAIDNSGKSRNDGNAGDSSYQLCRNTSRDGNIERTGNLGVASADNAEAVKVVARKMDWPVESTPTDVEI